MPRPKGLPKTGGRQRGSCNKQHLSREAAKQAVEAVKSEAAKHGQSPVEYMLAVMRDESASLDRRDRMAAAAAPYVCPRLAVVDVNAKVKTEDTALLNDEERRQRARQMILEAFAERPAIPDLRVVAGREMSQSVGESMGGGKVIDAIPLEKHEKEPSEGG